MHQPSYKDPFSGKYVLPWVRLHGVKDYLDTMQMLEDFPAIRQTFNVVPSLIDQLNDYILNGAQDYHLELTLKSPSELTWEEKVFIIEYFFLANWDTMVKPFPRYYELLIRRGMRYLKSDLNRIVRYFSDDDIRDLQVLFNLSWIDPMFRTSDPFLAELVGKGREYTEEEKRQLIVRQYDILKRIVPEYRKLASSGQIEISVSPFYHPILPLLWDTDSAKIAMPGSKMPKKRFSHPEDAVNQIKTGIEFFEKNFGFRPAGMWPPEGAVSEDVASAIYAAGIKWIATDEEVLSRSLDKTLREGNGHVTDAKALYSPYSYEGLTIFFRDHKLSDQIGFVYSGWNADKAVEDFIGKLSDIRNSLPDGGPFIVSVILDGENAWEYYKNDGQDFLKELYGALSRDSRFKTVTMSGFLNEFGTIKKLGKLHSGSWINADFHVWIGHEEDNLAWDYLSQTRDDLATYASNHPDRDISEAWKALYASEGSDWNWWYGDDHASDNAREFDELFRNYLIRVYQVIGKEVPPSLYDPILTENRDIEPDTELKGFITPRIDGSAMGYFEWYNSGHLMVKQGGGSMHRSDSLVTDIYYGFDKENMYIRADITVPLSQLEETVAFCVDLTKPSVCRIIIDHSGKEVSFFTQDGDKWIEKDVSIQAAVSDIFEMAIPFACLHAIENDEILFSFQIIRKNYPARSAKEMVSATEDIIERCPNKGQIKLIVPPPDYEKKMWH
jgi:alpha-amylase/alpha-mannosidase (GH57 family)